MTLTLEAPTRRVARPRTRWRGPQYEGEVCTLGWQVLEHASAHLPSPADDTKPLVFTDEQARLVLEWHRIDPETGRKVYRRGQLETAKGWGKSPWAAVDALEAFCGPVEFDGWDADGQPVGVPWGYGGRPAPWVQIAAVSEDQTENTYGVLYQMLTVNDGRAARELKIDTGRTRLHFTDGRPGTLEPITTSAPSAEGARITHGILDETHLYFRSNHGIALAGVLRRNVAKMGGRTLETTNAPVLGLKSVAEMSGVDFESGAAGIFRFAPRPKIEPDPSWPDERLRVALIDANPDAYWVDLGRRIEEIRDPATPWDEALRFWFNIRTTGAGRAVDPRQWDDLTKPRDVPAGTIIGMGFDGSTSQDSTVLRGCTADGYRFTIGTWVRPKGDDLLRWRHEHPDERDWSVNRREVNDLVDWAFATYRVGLFHPDPPKWYDEIEVWRRTYGKNRVGAAKDETERVVDFDSNQPTRMAPAVDRWRTAIREGTTTHDADPVAAEHVKHAQLRKVHLHQDAEDGRTRYVLMKGEDGFQIDGAIADVLAYEAAMTMDPPPAEISRTMQLSSYRGVR